MRQCEGYENYKLRPKCHLEFLLCILCLLAGAFPIRILASSAPADPPVSSPYIRGSWADAVDATSLSWRLKPLPAP